MKRERSRRGDAGTVRLNGRLAARWARRTVERLRRERSEINAINVFPVADSDTGTNLYHTVRSAYRAVEDLSGPTTLPEVLSAMATGALRGARGNSGLILSVALRGVADALADVTEPDAASVARALEFAAQRSREAIAAPVDGTMLTVLEAIAEEARERADAGDELVPLLAAVRDRSRSALRETTGQLSVLRDNGVVDAGSTGIVELVDLLYLTVTGRTPEEDLSVPAEDEPAELLVRDGEEGLEIVCHLGAEKDRSRPLKRALTKLGAHSIVVSWPMVHLHIDDEAAARVAVAALEEHTIVDMRTEDLAVTSRPQPASAAIAFADGSAMMLTLALSESLVVRSDRPDLVEAAGDLVDDSECPVVLLPDSPATRKALKPVARSRSREDVRLLRTVSPAGVLAALAVFDPAAPLEEIAEDLVEAVAGQRVGSVIVAVEDHDGGKAPHTAGDLLTVVDGRVRAASGPDELGAAAADLVDRLLGAGGELLTVITGVGVDEPAVQAILDAVAADHPEVEVQHVVGGGEALLVIGAE